MADGQRQVGGPAAEDALSEATRLMCAGAYIDEGFARLVVQELFGQTSRAVAPSHGFDLRTVALHCLAVRHGNRVRDGLLVAGAVVMLLMGSVATVWSGIFWAVVGWVIGSLGAESGGLRSAVDRLTFGNLLFAAIVAGAALLIASVWSGILFALRVAGGSPPDLAAPSLLLNPFLGFLGSSAGWFVLYLIVLTSLAVRRRNVVRDLRPAAFRARPAPQVSPAGRLRQRLDVIASGQHGNVTVYSGFDPFMGTGRALRGWSFAIPLLALPGREDALERFSVSELVAHLRRRFESIGGSDGLRGMVVSDRVFVHGLVVAGDERFMPRSAPAPRTHLGTDEVERIAAQPYGAARHYLSVHVRSWAGEVVTSTFFHFSTDGEKLYFECVKRALGPIRHQYHGIDVVPRQLSFGGFLRLAAEAAARTVPLVVGAPARMIGDLAFDIRGERPEHDTIVHHGFRLSVRELAAEAWYHNYFQELDVDKHLKIVERHALGAILEFLDDHGIDTSEFDSRKSTILDQSVTVVGSGNVLGAVATGKGASATQSGTIGGAKEDR